MEQVYSPTKDYKVLVRCMTYNQSKYIEDALNGFAMQKTDFPFVCLVMDDASTDGEQEVIKGWMERECDMEKAENVEIEKSFITLVPHKSNSNCQFAFYFLKQNLYRKGGKAPMIVPWREHCEYEALCEGDDYWIDPAKLKRQFDVMSSNTDLSFCFTDVRNEFIDTCQRSTLQSVLFGEENKKINFASKEDAFYAILLGKCRIQPLSVMFRLSLFNKIPSNCEIHFQMGDTPLFLDLSQLGSIKYIDVCTGVYRIHSGSACRMKSTKHQVRFNLSSAEMRVYYCLKYNFHIPDSLKKIYNKSLCSYIIINPNNSHDYLFDLFKLHGLSYYFQYLVCNYKLAKRFIYICYKLKKLVW